MLSVYRPRRPRASPLWQIVHHAWDEFIAHYEARHRRTHGPLRKDALAVVDQFYRCGDLACRIHPPPMPRLRPREAPRLHLQEPPLLPQLPPAPCPLPRRLDCPRGLLRGAPPPVRLHHAPAPARHLPQAPQAPRPPLPRQPRVPARLDAHPPRPPHGQLGAVAAVQTFGDYLNFHPHLHVLAADRLWWIAKDAST